MRILSCLATILVVGAWPVARAWACGCFAQPNPVQRTVQAGERIVFAQRGEQIEMHVQVNYAGDADEFGWLLPVPSVPELTPGTDQLFAALDVLTRPQFFLQQRFDSSCDGVLERGFGGTDGTDFGDPVSDSVGGEAPPSSPVVSRENVGAFDAVVLDATDADAMFAWLAEEEFIVPVDANSAAIQPYLGPDRYFVALKLRSDRDTGDIQPLVLEFQAGGPVIPVTLTQVGATADMPVVVWVLGESRAIPRNYRHTTLNLEHLDWFSNGSNYVEVVTAAVDEAEGAHSFVTEYAQPLGRTPPAFATPDLAASSVEAVTNLQELVNVLQGGGLPFDAKLVGLLRDFVPFPEEQAGAQGLDADTFYGLLFFLVNSGQIDGSVIPVDGGALAGELFTEVVEPLERARELFDDFGYLTRMFTTLSPDEMTLDPSFNFSTALADVDNVQQATFTQFCDGDRLLDQGWLELPDGRRFATSAPGWQTRIGAVDAPFSARIEALRMDRAPDLLVDNSDRLSPSDLVGPGSADGGCQAVTPTFWVGLLGFSLLCVLARRRDHDPAA
jgi:hypothetical protein